MLVIPHRVKKIGLHNLVIRRIFSDILVVLGLKNTVLSDKLHILVCGKGRVIPVLNQLSTMS
jgi:hypothetical protein